MGYLKYLIISLWLLLVILIADFIIGGIAKSESDVGTLSFKINYYQRAEVIIVDMGNAVCYYSNIVNGNTDHVQDVQVSCVPKPPNRWK